MEVHQTSPWNASKVHSLSDDESFFTKQSQELEKQGRLDESRALILVAQTVFPQSFNIQFEAYRLDRDALCIKESAAHLQRLCRQFSDEPALWAEMRGVADALRSEESDEHSRFLRQVFCHLSTDLQHRALSVIADRSSDTLEHCQLVLLLLNKFPHMVDGHGTRVVDLLMTAEKHAPFKSPLNKYRKFLVCDLLPSLLQSRASDLTSKQLIRLFLRSMEFFVCYAIADSNKIQGTGDEQPTELRLADPWQDMRTICHLCAAKLHWPLADVFTHKRPREWAWQRLHAFYRDHPPAQEGPAAAAATAEAAGGGRAAERQLLYCTVAVLLQALVEYTQTIEPNTFSHAGTPSTPASGPSATPLLLVEAFVQPVTMETAAAAGTPTRPPASMAMRRRKSEDDLTAPCLTVSKQVSVRPQQLTQCFLTALRCWRLLTQNPVLEKELSRIWQQLGADSWSWLQSFISDARLYDGAFQQLAASRQLSSAAAAQLSAAGQCRQLLQRAAAGYNTGDYQMAGELCLRVLTGPLLPPALGDTAKVQVTAQCAQSRHLHFLSYTQADVTKYCLKTLILCLQQRILCGSTASDGAMGHLIVLLQHDWPAEEPAFAKLIEHIRERGGFSYPAFVQYVSCPDIVEEFVFLSTPHGGGLSFNLVPTQDTRQRTMSTRGVDKGAREEFRQAMLQLIRREQTPLTLISEFLYKEKDAVLRCLR